MRRGLAAVGRPLRQRDRIEESLPLRLNGIRVSIRRAVRPAPAADQLFCLDRHDPAADGVRLCRLAGQFLYLRSTGTSGQLSNSATVAQDRSAETLRANGRAVGRVLQCETAVR